MSARWRNRLEALAILLMVMGMVSIGQPWVFALYRRSFSVLLTGLIAYMVVTHIPIREHKEAAKSDSAIGRYAREEMAATGATQVSETVPGVRGEDAP